MNSKVPDLAWLENPEVFEVNREKAHSDHRFYESVQAMERGEAEEGKMGLKQCLNGTWKFSYAECPSKRKSNFYKEDFDLSDMEEIQVPGHIQTQGYDKRQYINTMYPWDGHSELRPPHIDWEYNPVASYIKEFDLKEELEQKRVFLSFQGVETAFYVWLNGEFVGYSEDSFTPSEFEITNLLKKTGNRLAVEVYKRSSASWIEDQDFFRFSGIFRDVYLYGIPKIHVRDMFVKADLKMGEDGQLEIGSLTDTKKGSLCVELELIHGDFESCKDSLKAEYVSCQVKAVLKDKTGTIVCQTEPSCVEHGKAVINAELSDIYPWSIKLNTS